jgi:hypothetical protein
MSGPATHPLTVPDTVLRGVLKVAGYHFPLQVRQVGSSYGVRVGGAVADDRACVSITITAMAELPNPAEDGLPVYARCDTTVAGLNSLVYMPCCRGGLDGQSPSNTHPNRAAIGWAKPNQCSAGALLPFTPLPSKAWQ